MKEKGTLAPCAVIKQLRRAVSQAHTSTSTCDMDLQDCGNKKMAFYNYVMHIMYEFVIHIMYFKEHIMNFKFSSRFEDFMYVIYIFHIFIYKNLSEYNNNSFGDEIVLD